MQQLQLNSSEMQPTVHFNGFNNNSQSCFRFYINQFCQLCSSTEQISSPHLGEISTNKNRVVRRAVIAATGAGKFKRDFSTVSILEFRGCSDDSAESRRCSLI